MRPANGWYTVHATDENGNETTVTYHVTDAGIPTTFGLLAWDGPGDIFRKGDIGLRCTGTGVGVAVNGATNYATDCAKIL